MKSNAAIDDDEADQGLRLLLGGLSPSDIGLDAWKYESEEEEAASPEECNVKKLQQAAAPSQTNSKGTRSLHVDLIATPSTVDDEVFSLAYKCSGCRTPNGKLEPPKSVQIVDLPEKGKALIATRRISKGEVIYTERAAVSTQVDQTVRACQYCFRSLCAISSLSTLSPLPHLWPVLELDFIETMGPARRDRYGRVQCVACESFFCSQFCQANFESNYGCCCKLLQAQHDIPHLLRTDNEESTVLDPAITLAIRMFALHLCHHRRYQRLSPILAGLCGDSSDIQALELGMVSRRNNFDIRYTLEPVYDHLLEVFGLTDEEQQQRLSPTFFSALVAQAARNSFGIHTQSPFQSYYAAVIRSTGRGSETQKEVNQHVARVFGGGSEELERGMDQRIQERVSPEIAALFPLTARINHDCSPNAQVRSEFADHHIDLVALSDILPGEEVTISYIRTDRKNQAQRNRELQAKFLFLCECPSCGSVGNGARNGWIEASTDSRSRCILRA